MPGRECDVQIRRRLSGRPHCARGGTSRRDQDRSGNRPTVTMEPPVRSCYREGAHKPTGRASWRGLITALRRRLPLARRSGLTPEILDPHRPKPLRAPSRRPRVQSLGRLSPAPTRQERRCTAPTSIAGTVPEDAHPAQVRPPTAGRRSPARSPVQAGWRSPAQRRTPYVPSSSTPPDDRLAPVRHREAAAAGRPPGRAPVPGRVHRVVGSHDRLIPEGGALLQAPAGSMVPVVSPKPSRVPSALCAKPLMVTVSPSRR